MLKSLTLVELLIALVVVAPLILLLFGHVGGEMAEIQWFAQWYRGVPISLVYGGIAGYYGGAAAKDGLQCLFGENAPDEAGFVFGRIVERGDEDDVFSRLSHIEDLLRDQAHLLDLEGGLLRG